MTFDQFKDPDATLDYEWDWTDWLAENEVIATVTWIVPAGITVGATPNTDSKATIWLSGGTIDQRYPITCRIATDQGRIDDRTQTIQVRAR